MNNWQWCAKLFSLFHLRYSPIQREQIDYDADKNDGNNAHHNVDFSTAAHGVGHFNGLCLR
jgi:hypothetical protein